MGKRTIESFFNRIDQAIIRPAKERKTEEAGTSSNDQSNSYNFGPGTKILFNPKADGACQFSAVSHLLMRRGINMSSCEIREETVNFLRDNPYCGRGDKATHFSEFICCESQLNEGGFQWNQYLEKMRNPFSYGDHITLQAISKLHNLQVVVLSTLGLHATCIVCPNDDEDATYDANMNTILLGHAKENEKEKSRCKESTDKSDAYQKYTDPKENNDCIGEHYVSLEANQQAWKTIVTTLNNEPIRVADIVLPTSLNDASCTEDQPTHTPTPKPVIVAGRSSESTQSNTDSRSTGITLQTHEDTGSDSFNMVRFLKQSSIINEYDVPGVTDLYNNNLPYCWTEAQRNYFQREYCWLVVSNKSLGCSTCRDVKNLGVHKSRGLKLSSEWINVSVSSYGATIKKQQSSLRKKISDHKDSECHKRAAIVLSNSHVGAIEQSIAEQSREHHETTCRVFRTVYKEIKLNRPFTDLQSDIDLQVLNGLNMGRILHSNFSCGNIARHIGQEMRKKLISAALANGQKLAVLVDESTTISRITMLIVYVRVALDLEHEPITFFLDLVSLTSTAAAEITAALLNCLNRHGITDNVLKERFVGFACDGASVMLGKSAGVAALLLVKYPKILVWHCVAHRLELSVGDTLKEVAGTNNFKIFMDKLYSVYSMSPKNQAELKDCADVLDLQLLKIGKILHTRWVSSSLRTVAAVWQSYPALYKHFNDASQDGNRDARERAKYAGLATHLATNEFVKNLALMFDTLQELSDLSLELQKRDMTISDAHRSICRQIYVFEAMSANPGEHYTLAMKSVLNGSFKKIALHGGSKTDVTINHGQFCTSLCVNLKSRMMAFQSSHVSQKNVSSSSSSQYATFIDEIKCLYPINWPDDYNIMYGDESIASLSERFNIDKRSTVRAFRSFKDNGGKNIPDALKPLMLALNTVPVSTAECERGFSEMNLLATPIRNSLNVDTLSEIMLVKLVGPPLKQFKPKLYVTNWLLKGHHSADDTNSKMCSGRVLASSSNYEHMWTMI